MMSYKLFLVGLLVGISFMVSCDALSDLDESCTTEFNYCDTEKELKNCCTSKQCYFEFDGKRYDCDGTDCEEAAERLLEEACPQEPEPEETE